jgi:predicted transcriptional regulator
MAQRRFYRQIVIRYIAVPTSEVDIDADIDYIYQCLGLGDERDEVGLVVFRALVKSSMRGEGISSRDVMQLSETSQAAVIYHLNNFQRSGLLVKDGRNYYLRGHTLEQTLEEMEGDIHSRFEHLKSIARKIGEKK